METRPPGSLRTIRLLAGLALRRWVNRNGARFRRRMSPKPGEPRAATARKERGGGAWLFMAGLMLLLSGINISVQFLARLASGLQEGPGGEPVVHGVLRRGLSFDWGGDLVRSAGLILALLAFCHLWLSLGTGNQDLGRVEWSLEWLFTFPAPAGRIFLAKVFEYAVVNPFGWFMIFPFLLTAYWTRGHAGWAIPEAAAATVALGFVLGSIRLTAETWLRMRLAIDRLKNVQAGCTLVGTVLWLGVLWLAMAQPVPAFFLQAAPRLPALALWNPFSAAVLFCDPGVAPWSPAGLLGASAVLFPLAGSALCRFFVREGLLTSSGTFQGSRQAAPSGPERRPLFHGILAKDLRLLFRDRNFLVGTLVVPVLVFAFQAVLYPNLLRGVTGDFRHAATLAYGLGAYILMSSAFHVLTVEGQSLWLLYTFPRELHRILIEKTVVWAAMALLYAGIALGVTAGFSGALDWGSLSLAVTALVGVVLAAFTAAALGTLAADPLQQDVQRKIRAEIVYLYMLLSGMYGYALYGPSAWLRLVQVILSTLLVLALWQKVRDRLPYLLDPTEMPPPRIALADGLIAVLAFFILQGLIGAVAAQDSIGPWVIVSYAGAGAAVVLLSLYIFWRLRVPGLLEAVGLRSTRGSVGRALVLGPMAGLSAAVLGIAYLIVIQQLEVLKPFLEEQSKMAERLRQEGLGWLALLAVVAAPLFEEYLFRGLVFKGMRRSMKPAVAVVASAAIFAIVHPPLAFLPVFGLGVAAALAFEGSGLLLAPILAHVIYNASVIYVPKLVWYFHRNLVP
jgi:ABC-2 type transport system permease protein